MHALDKASMVRRRAWALSEDCLPDTMANPVLQDFAKDGNPKEFLMPMWTLEELKAADSFEPRGGDTIQAVIDIYGLKARYFQTPDPESPLAQSVSLSTLQAIVHCWESWPFHGC